jgi:hypothetical protein
MTRAGVAIAVAGGILAALVMYSMERLWAMNRTDASSREVMRVAPVPTSSVWMTTIGWDCTLPSSQPMRLWLYGGSPESPTTFTVEYDTDHYRCYQDYGRIVFELKEAKR